jgi:hypothetical protein
MNIYTPKREHSKYRRIYKQHFGDIPREPNSRSYDIHHKDGNHSNNDPSNLVAVTLQEHYDIHYVMKDWGACIAIEMRMDSDPNLISELNRKRVEDGTHNFSTRSDGTNLQQDRVANGIHHFVGGTNPVHQQLKDGTHPSQYQWYCPHCERHGKGKGVFTRYHGDGCKMKE